MNTPTNTTAYKFLSAFFALVIAVLVASSLKPTFAQEAVCGDGDVDIGEQCDDGNLVSGDDCSDQCWTEVCGNGITDVYEQCDDGNAAAGDGCSDYCRIEFCGDRDTQGGTGEQCDDGNGVNGDGCSDTCQYEGEPPESSSSSSEASESSASSEDQAEPVPGEEEQEEYQSEQTNDVTEAQAAVIQQATQAFEFLKGDTAVEYKEKLTSSEQLKLEDVLNKLKNGRRLNAEERVWAEELLVKMEEAKVATRQTYTDLLKQFIATPISSDVVKDKNMTSTRLVDVEVPVAIEELERAVSIIRRGDLKKQVVADIGKLQKQEINISLQLPSNYQTYLEPGTQPLQVFATLKLLKEATETHATTDLAASYVIIRQETALLRQALPVLMREYSIDEPGILALLDAIDTAAATPDKLKTQTVVDAVNKLLTAFEASKIISRAELSSLTAEESTFHAAAGAQRIAKAIDASNMVQNSQDIAPFIEQLTLTAPADLKDIFALGTAPLQRDALILFINRDPKIIELRGILTEDGQTEFETGFAELEANIRNIGTPLTTDTPCDDTVADALICTTTYLQDLQDAVRGRSFFSRIVGSLQDLFGISS